MKALKVIVALTLALLMLFMTACAGNTPDDGDATTEATQATTAPKDDDDDGANKGAPAPTPTRPDEGDTVYNIIFALATIPPVLSALDSIANGHETYAIIERGKTYNGIDKLEHFHNAGFDAANNQSSGFSDTEFNAMVEQISSLKGDKAFFNIYVQDGTALRGAALAANAGLALEDFHVYMCEDGTKAYEELYNNYVKGKTVTEETDGIFDNYLTQRNTVKEQFETIMSKKDNKNSDTELKYSVPKAFALASLDNFTYYIQDEALVVDHLESVGGEKKTALLSACGADGYNDTVDFALNLKYQKISQAVSKLTEAQRTDYLTLMYGDYYEDTYNTLTRTSRAGEKAPDKKLVYIGARHAGYPLLATDAAYGIGGLASDATLPTSYAELDSKYKTALFFSSEADYNAFLAVVNNADNYTETTDQLKEMAKVACFNVYINYIFSLKMTYAIYGEEYDIIMKGHPRESLGCYSEWGERYKVTVGEGNSAVTYCYDKLMDTALVAFHSSDSTGKFSGTVPYGTAAENLAYLGTSFSVCGLPSSTYTGYDTNIDVLFIANPVDGNISGDNNVKERYEAGTLLYTKADGSRVPTVYYNIGNSLKAIAKIYSELGDNANATKYTNLFNTWLNATHAGATDINDQGFPTTANN
ncbi:MAG: hypothetical protein IJV72_07395 [Clostridia bacterium]|nr:hypothetical protein [Clostridia bacterium]